VAAPVFIIGKGTITAIGDNTRENFDSLIQEQTGIRKIQRLDTIHQSEIPAAEVKYTNEELAAMLELNHTTTRTALLSMKAASEAYNDAGLEKVKHLRSGFISANSVGGMDKTEDFIKFFLEDRSKGKLHDVVNHDCGASSEIVAAKLGIKDLVSTISTACSSSANAIMYASRLIQNGVLDWAIAGGTDALSRFTLNGFNSLMILDKEFCRPFDDSRKGLNLGEGAGYIVLASEEVVKFLGLNPKLILSGYANANDAFHQTASSADGVGNFMAMDGALRKANLKPEEIDYVNLHGTGTSNNDSSEGKAIERLFLSKIPLVSSTKSFTGHTLGGCGGVEAVYSCLAIEEETIFANLRFQHKMQDLNITPVTTTISNKPIQHVLSNSFGFGGNCSSLIFSKID
jgi:3-oxoacyl-[acyl-carrier-protein] synthase-1